MMDNIEREMTPPTTKVGGFSGERNHKDIEYSSNLQTVSEDGCVLRPAQGHHEKLDRINITDVEDTEDGTFPRVSDYVKFCNKVDHYDYVAVQNFIIGKTKKQDRGSVVLHKVNNDKIRLVFTEPILVYFGKIGNEPILREVKEIEGTLSHDFYWCKYCRQDNIASGISLFIEELVYLK